MAKKKYEHLIKPLDIAALPPMPGGVSPFKNTGNADINYWLNGVQHLDGLALNFSWGFYTGLGDWHPGMDPHVHPYPECLVFVGLDPHNVGYLGAEMEYCLGEELEVHRFDRPTVLVVPAGLPHCPSVTRNVFNPIGYSFFIISLGAHPRTTWMGDGIPEERIAQMRAGRTRAASGPAMESTFSKKKIHVSKETLTYGHKYDRFVKTLRPLPKSALKKAAAGVKPGPGAADQPVWMYGRDLEGMDVTFAWGFHTRPGTWERRPGGADGAHVHPCDEVLVFVGTEPADIDYLGAEISIDLGQEEERYIISKPTAVICPGGLRHGPVIARYVDRPYATILIALSGEHRTNYVA